MPVTLTVNHIPFEYPIPGDSPGWGEGATGWAEEVTTVLNDILGPNDIIETTFNIVNNQISPANIVGLSFNTGSVRAATIEYSVYRTSSTHLSGQAESGTLSIVYDNLAASGFKWSLVGSNLNGISGVTFSILDSGQFQYISTDIGNTGYSGVLHFRAKTLGQ